MLTETLSSIELTINVIRHRLTLVGGLAAPARQYGLGEDVYDDDRAAAAKREGPPVEAANGPRVMSGTIQTVVTERSRM